MGYKEIPIVKILCTKVIFKGGGHQRWPPTPPLPTTAFPLSISYLPLFSTTPHLFPLLSLELNTSTNTHPTPPILVTIYVSLILLSPHKYLFTHTHIHIKKKFPPSSIFGSAQKMTMSSTLTVTPYKYPEMVRMRLLSEMEVTLDPRCTIWNIYYINPQSILKSFSGSITAWPIIGDKNERYTDPTGWITLFKRAFVDVGPMATLLASF